MTLIYSVSEAVSLKIRQSFFISIWKEKVRLPLAWVRCLKKWVKTLRVMMMQFILSQDLYWQSLRKKIQNPIMNLPVIMFLSRFNCQVKNFKAKNNQTQSHLYQPFRNWILQTTSFLALAQTRIHLH